MIQLTFTCSKSTLETLENFSSVSIVDFEQVNVSWEIFQLKQKVLDGYLCFLNKDVLKNNVELTRLFG